MTHAASWNRPPRGSVRGAGWKGEEMRQTIVVGVVIAACWLGATKPSVAKDLGDDLGNSVTITSESLAIHPEQVQIGDLAHVAAIVLRSKDERFGGLSGLTVLDGRRLVAISDRGHWLTGQLTFDPSGRLRGLRDSRMGPLVNIDGAPVLGRAQRDAEELLRVPDGSWMVSFEGDHRLWRYSALDDPSKVLVGRPVVVPTPPDLQAAGDNGGIEAMALVADGRLLMLTEDMRDDEGAIRGWIGPVDGSGWRALALAPTGSFKPTGAVALANGDALLVERSFDLLAGVRIRVSVLPRAQLVEGGLIVPRKLARLLPTNHIDNLEAIGLHVRDDGTHVIFLLSDDNFRPQQRTVLLQLTWHPG